MKRRSYRPSASGYAVGQRRAAVRRRARFIRDVYAAHGAAARILNPKAIVKVTGI